MNYMLKKNEFSSNAPSMLDGDLALDDDEDALSAVHNINFV